MKITNKLTPGLILALSMLFNPATMADGLTDAFSDFQSSTTSAGAYKSKSRVAVTLGSVSARFENTSISLFNYTPPKFSAGCGGIDAHFGGFSFVNGIDFQQLVANVGQNALGLVIHLAIKVGCEQCHSVLEQIQEWAQIAADLSLDSCTAAKSLLSIGGAANDLCNAMAGAAEYTNLNDDSADARKRCNSEVNSWNTYQDMLDTDKKPEGGSDGDAEKRYKGKCDLTPNPTWCALTHMKLLPTKEDASSGTSKLVPMTVNEITTGSYTEEKKKMMLRGLGFAEIIMNVMPSERTNKDSSADENSNNSAQNISTETLAGDLYDFAVCGDKTLHTGEYADISAQFKKHCEEAWKNTVDFEIPVCAEDGIPSGDPQWVDCPDTSTLVNVKTWAESRDFFDGRGLYVTVAKALQDIQEKINTGSGALSLQEKSFIGAAPLPLYQLFNLSAVYPDISDNVISHSSTYLADTIANEYFLSNFTLVSRNLHTKDLDRETLKLIKEEISKMHEVFDNEDFKKVGNAKFNHDKAFREFLLQNLAAYQNMLYSDIADQQYGANLSASFGNITHLKNKVTPPSP